MSHRASLADLLPKQIPAADGRGRGDVGTWGRVRKAQGGGGGGEGMGDVVWIKWVDSERSDSSRRRPCRRYIRTHFAKSVKGCI